MTSETRVLIEPKDVLGIDLQCECGASVFYPITDTQPQFIFKCPSCPRDWFRSTSDPRTGAPVNKASEQLAMLMKAVQGLNMKRDDIMAVVRLRVSSDRAADKTD